MGWNGRRPAWHSCLHIKPCPASKSVEHVCPSMSTLMTPTQHMHDTMLRAFIAEFAAMFDYGHFVNVNIMCVWECERIFFLAHANKCCLKMDLWTLPTQLSYVLILSTAMSSSLGKRRFLFFASSTEQRRAHIGNPRLSWRTSPDVNEVESNII